LPVGNLTVADAPPALPESQLKGMIEAAGGVEKAYDTGKQVVEKVKRQFRTDEEQNALDKAESAKTNKANGGLVGHYASGGASSGPYGIPISKVETPDLITAGDAPEFQKSGFLKMLDMAGDAASLGSQAASASSKNKAAGGAAEDDVGAGTPYDAGSNPFMPDSAKGIEKKELAKPGAAPGAPESGFSQAMSAANSVAKIAALAMQMNRGGRTGYANGGVGDEEELNYPTQEGGIPSPTPVEVKELPAPGAYSALSHAEKVALNARMDAQLNAAGNNREAPQERTPVPAPQPQKPAQTPARYANVPFEKVQSNIIDGENRGVADPYNSVYGSGKYGTIEGGPTSRTLGDVQDFQRNTLIPATRGKIAGVAPNMGTGAVGAYQFTHGTLSSIAPQVFGKDWRNVPFNQENQDKMARALYEQNRGSDTNLARQWSSFSGLAPSGRALVAQSRGVVPPPISSELAGAPAYQQRGLVPQPPAANAAAAPVNPAASTDGLAGKQYAQLDTGVKSDAAPAGLQPSGRVPMPKPDIEAGPYNKTERWLLPLLAGLGDMAGSSNRYGLGALAEGIGGGASAYARMQENQYSKGQEQQSKGIEAQTAQTGTTEAQNRIRQTDLEIIRLILSNLTKQYDSLTGQSIWINSITGQKLTDDQRDDLVQKLNTLGGSRLGGIGQPSVSRLNIAGGDTNASPPGSATPSRPPARQGATAPPVKTSFSGPATPGHPSVIGVPVTSIQVDESRLPEAYRPSVLNRIIQKANSDILNINNDQTLDPDTKKQQLEGLNNIVQDANRRRVDLQSGNVFDESGQPIMEARNLHEQTAVNMAVNQKTPDVVRGVQTALLTLDKTADVLKNYATGAYSPIFAQASQWIGSGENASNRQILSKEAVNSIIAQLNASARPLGAGIGVMNEVSDATFGPDLQPSANKAVLAQIYGLANWNQALAKAMQSAFAANQSYDQGKFVEDWSAANPIKQFEEAAYKNLPVFGASPKLADDNRWRKEYNDHGPGGLYIIPANDNQSGKDLLVRFKGIAKNGTPIIVPERQ